MVVAEAGCESKFGTKLCQKPLGSQKQHDFLHAAAVTGGSSGDYETTKVRKERATSRALSRLKRFLSVPPSRSLHCHVSSYNERSRHGVSVHRICHTTSRRLISSPIRRFRLPKYRYCYPCREIQRRDVIHILKFLEGRGNKHGFFLSESPEKTFLWGLINPVILVAFYRFLEEIRVSKAAFNEQQKRRYLAAAPGQVREQRQCPPLLEAAATQKLPSSTGQQDLTFFARKRVLIGDDTTGCSVVAGEESNEDGKAIKKSFQDFGLVTGEQLLILDVLNTLFYSKTFVPQARFAFFAKRLVEPCLIVLQAGHLMNEALLTPLLSCERLAAAAAQNEELFKSVLRYYENVERSSSLKNVTESALVKSSDTLRAGDFSSKNDSSPMTPLTLSPSAVGICCSPHTSHLLRDSERKKLLSWNLPPSGADQPESVPLPAKSVTEHSCRALPHGRQQGKTVKARDQEALDADAEEHQNKEDNVNVMVGEKDLRCRTNAAWLAASIKIALTAADASWRGSDAACEQFLANVLAVLMKHLLPPWTVFLESVFPEMLKELYQPRSHVSVVSGKKLWKQAKEFETNMDSGCCLASSSSARQYGSRGRFPFSSDAARNAIFASTMSMKRTPGSVAAEFAQSCVIRNTASVSPRVSRTTGSNRYFPNLTKQRALRRMPKLFYTGKYENKEDTTLNIGGRAVVRDSPNYALTFAMMLGMQKSNDFNALIVTLRHERHQTDIDLDFLLEEPLLLAVRQFHFSCYPQLPRTCYCVFGDIAPEAFECSRELAGITEQDYRNSMCQTDFSFIEFDSNSKSGQFFLFSHDGKYLIKSISLREVKQVLKILPAYIDHLLANPNSLLTRIFGIHRVELYERSTGDDVRNERHPETKKGTLEADWKQSFFVSKRIHNVPQQPPEQINSLKNEGRQISSQVSRKCPPVINESNHASNPSASRVSLVEKQRRASASTCPYQSLTGVVTDSASSPTSPAVYSDVEHSTQDVYNYSEESGKNVNLSLNRRRISVGNSGFSRGVEHFAHGQLNGEISSAFLKRNYEICDESANNCQLQHNNVGVNVGKEVVALGGYIYRITNEEKYNAAVVPVTSKSRNRSFGKNSSASSKLQQVTSRLQLHRTAPELAASMSCRRVLIQSQTQEGVFYTPRDVLCVSKDETTREEEPFSIDVGCANQNSHFFDPVVSEALTTSNAAAATVAETQRSLIFRKCLSLAISDHTHIARKPSASEAEICHKMNEANSTGSTSNQPGDRRCSQNAADMFSHEFDHEACPHEVPQLDRIDSTLPQIAAEATAARDITRESQDLRMKIQRTEESLAVVGDAKKVTSAYFIVVGTVFDSQLDLQEVYDLKGSTVSRRARATDRVKKDMDWRDARRRLEMRKKEADTIIESHAMDCQFLEAMGVFDYSILIGIHKCEAHWAEQMKLSSVFSTEDHVGEEPSNFEPLRQYTRRHQDLHGDAPSTLQQKQGFENSLSANRPSTWSSLSNAADVTSVPRSPLLSSNRFKDSMEESKKERSHMRATEGRDHVADERSSDPLKAKSPAGEDRASASVIAACASGDGSADVKVDSISSNQESPTVNCVSDSAYPEGHVTMEYDMQHHLTCVASDRVITTTAGEILSRPMPRLQTVKEGCRKEGENVECISAVRSGRHELGNLLHPGSLALPAKGLHEECSHGENSYFECRMMTQTSVAQGVAHRNEQSGVKTDDGVFRSIVTLLPTAECHTFSGDDPKTEPTEVLTSMQLDSQIQESCGYEPKFSQEAAVQHVFPYQPDSPSLGCPSASLKHPSERPPQKGVCARASTLAGGCIAHADIPSKCRAAVRNSPRKLSSDLPEVPPNNLQDLGNKADTVDGQAVTTGSNSNRISSPASLPPSKCSQEPARSHGDQQGSSRLPYSRTICSMYNRPRICTPYMSPAYSKTGFGVRVMSSDLSEIYFLGIIDFLTLYSLKRYGHTAYKRFKSTLRCNFGEISPMPPRYYSHRQQRFLRSRVIKIVDTEAPCWRAHRLVQQTTSKIGSKDEKAVDLSSIHDNTVCKTQHDQSHRAQ